jgi:two-component system LytT family response regulator
VDQTIADLEERLNPSRFVRIHRGVIVNLDHVLDLHAEFGGRDGRAAEGRRADVAHRLARPRVRTLKERLGI